MDVVGWVLGGQVQAAIVGLMKVAGGEAVGLTGRDGGLIRLWHNPAQMRPATGTTQGCKPFYQGLRHTLAARGGGDKKINKRPAASREDNFRQVEEMGKG